MFSEALRILDRNTANLMVDRLKEEVDNLKDENSELKGENSELKDENAKLLAELQELRDNKH